MTQRQKNDLETVKYFIPSWVYWSEITEKDELMFLENSERGLHVDKIHGAFFQKKNRNGFNALIQGKKWRGIHMEMYEDGVMDCTMPYYEILENQPRSVVNFIKKEMFQGKDADVIEACYRKAM